MIRKRPAPAETASGAQSGPPTDGRAGSATAAAANGSRPVLKVLPPEGSDGTGAVRLEVSGNWKLRAAGPDVTEAESRIRQAQGGELVISARDLGAWDTSLIAVLLRLGRLADAQHMRIRPDDSLPRGVVNLIDLAKAVPPHQTEAKPKLGFLGRVGESVSKIPGITVDVLEFLGEVTLSFWNLFRGKAVVRKQDVWTHLQEASISALPIVALISVLVGLILAFVGVVQLRMFRAEIYVSSLVAIGMTRIMGAIMTGIVLAGRTGASYAAIIGSMQVNEEVDALKSLGIQPVDYLVLPRVIALSIMTPLLVLYADFMGIMGGFFVGSVVLNIDPVEYLNFTQRALKTSHIIVGVIHGFVFGVIVAVAGCYQGLRSGRSAEAVGQATTSAVVNAIVYIIVATAILTILFNILNI